MLNFFGQNHWGDKYIQEQGRALWTAYCIHHDLPVGNPIYTKNLQCLRSLAFSELASQLRDDPEFDIMDCYKMHPNAFLGFMSEHL